MGYGLILDWSSEYAEKLGILILCLHSSVKSFEVIMSSASRTNFLPIDKLLSSNYSTWRKDICVLLLEKSLWECTSTKLLEVENTVKAPTATQLAKRIWAYYPILECVQRSVCNMASIREIYFYPSNYAYIVELTDAFFKGKQQLGEELNWYGSRLWDIIMQLKNAGPPISEWLKPFQLIQHLLMSTDVLSSSFIVFWMRIVASKKFWMNYYLR